MLCQERRRCTKDSVVRSQLASDQIWRNVVANTDIEIDTFISQIHQPIFHIKAQLQLRILSCQGGQRRSHHLSTKTKATDDAQHPLRNLPDIREFIHHLIDIMQNTLRPFIDALTLFRNGDATRGAVQQNHIQVLFKQRNAFADIGG
ncbi:hypothetical protein SDC9_124520 [bioreactor metagenome]|uniref:Uncharacterized protein n=1 Tax=bioreactor metagenome TaxID=1076179 RepID=A0A645CKP5_9ZZZZ